ncbi:glycosyltransferase family 4 protein [Neptunomonas japonica]|uniref:Glycosyl transferase family 1 n=1 Tax=Neptunomonas japonica JAMM 1380 TaxID=1441457 RepID=A0A7R6SV06_9GAMM|nr:glycosyltransferase family 4 protein [Neptunomonas japonica]BBB28217.1 glycosyl transferase family 1 [Neptunomonas japonica JAMM 1380]
MKVIQVLPDLNGGGVEKGTLEVAQALVEAGHESVVVSAGGSMVERLLSLGSRHVCWDLGRKSLATLRHIWAVRKWLRQEKADILHLRSRMPAWIMWLAWRGLPLNERPRLVTTVHGLYSVSWYSAIMCKGERVIAVSDTVQRYIADNYPATDLNKVVRIFRGVDHDEFPYGLLPEGQWLDAWYEQYPHTKGRVILTLPGRLTRLKGHHDFIELMASLKQAGLNVCGLIVGGEDDKRKSYADELYVKVKDAGLEGDIFFTGARSDIRHIYAISNVVFSLSSKPESFGRTVLESLRIGTATVGYDHGGVGEILTALFPAGLVAKGDIGECALRTQQIVKEKLKPENASLFTRKEMLERTLALYCDLLKPANRKQI